MNRGWEDYFSLRHRESKIGRIVGIPFGICFLVAESILLSQPIFDPTMTIFGLDPILVLSVSSVAGASLSYIFGSMIGCKLWHLKQPQLRSWMTAVCLISYIYYSVRLFSLSHIIGLNVYFVAPKGLLFSDCQI